MFVEAAARDKEEFQRKLTIYNESIDHSNNDSITSSSVNIKPTSTIVSDDAPTETSQHKKKKKKDKKRKSDLEADDGSEASEKHKKFNFFSLVISLI